MFRQIKNNPQQYKLKYHTYELIQTYELKPVNYGVACAPYLATKCLIHLSALEELNYPIGSRILRREVSFGMLFKIRL